MLARIRKSMDERDQGFTLIELLVVMIIIGILAAIAIPVFLSQRAKARDTSTKADVSTVGKELATYFVEPAATPDLAVTQAAAGADIVITDQATTVAVATIKVSTGTKLIGTASAANMKLDTGWCVALDNASGKQRYYKYAAGTGLTTAPSTGCV